MLLVPIIRLLGKSEFYLPEEPVLLLYNRCENFLVAIPVERAVNLLRSGRNRSQPEQSQGR